MGNQVGHGHVQRDQRLLEVLDIEIVDLFYQAVRQVSLVQQTLQAFMAIKQRQRLSKKLLGDFQDRLDLRFDTGLASDFIGRVEQVWHLVDIGADETCHHHITVDFRQLDGGVKVWQLSGQVLGEQARFSLMDLGTRDLHADGGGVHGNSRGGARQGSTFKNSPLS